MIVGVLGRVGQCVHAVKRRVFVWAVLRFVLFLGLSFRNECRRSRRDGGCDRGDGLRRCVGHSFFFGGREN